MTTHRLTITVPDDVYQALLSEKMDAMRKAKENVPMTRVIVDVLRCQLRDWGYLEYATITREPRTDGEWTRLPGGSEQTPPARTLRWTIKHFEEGHAVDDAPYQFKEDE